MGLDQYAFAVPGPLPAPVDFSEDDVIPADEWAGCIIQQWRKHPNLQGWMELLYARKGGQHEFNCKPVELTPADIDALEQALDSAALPETRGFFFGQSQPEDEELDRAFIRRAREAFKAGKAVYYSSWW